MQILCKRILLFVILTSTLISVSAQDDTHVFLYARLQPDSEQKTIYTYDLDTETATSIGTLANSWGDAGWSSDGQYVYFLYDNDGNYRSAELYNVDTGDIIPVSDELTKNPCSASLRWSPDDHFLAFNSPVDDNHSLQQILDLKAGDSFVLPDLPPLYNYYPDWSPNGRFLLQYILIENHGFNLILWDMDKREQLAELEQEQTGEVFWSPDSRYFTYIADQNEEQVTIFDTLTLTSQSFISKDVGKWSPDSSYLAYRHEDSLFVLDVEKQISQEVAIHPKLGYFVEWSFDSQYLAYMINDEQIGGIYVHETATGTSKRLTEDLPFTTYLLWSPKTHVIVYVQLLQDAYDNGRSNLNVYNLDNDSTIMQEVSIPSIFNDRPLDWSPSGDHLAVWADSGIHLFTIADGTFEHVNPSIPLTSSQRWSSDGAFLAYHTNGNIYVLDVGTGETLTFDDDNFIRFIGWRGTDKNTSLLYCGIG